MTLPPKPLKCGHTTLNRKCKECKSLFQEWNENLRLSGHVEIEDFNVPNGGPEDRLKSWDNNRFKSMNKEVLEANREYFSQCRDLLNTQAFESEEHKEIWRLYSEGYSTREIAKIINKKKLKRDTVRLIIKYYKQGLM